MKFTKMHGCGNDYIYINLFEESIDDVSELSIKLSNRNFGIGSDGIITIGASDKADAMMRIYNSDGSEAKMCGNGIRCCAKYLFDNKMNNEDNVVYIDTLSGIKKIIKENDLYLVDMGKPIINAKDIPVVTDDKSFINKSIYVHNEQLLFTAVSMGNPHVVTFVEDVDNFDVINIGKYIEKHEMFPEGVNVEFIEVIDNSTLKMRVWERGSGETLACGTGACAAVVAASLNGIVSKNKDILVNLIGGNLTIVYTDDTVIMKGDAVKVFEGTID